VAPRLPTRPHRVALAVVSACAALHTVPAPSPVAAVSDPGAAIRTAGPIGDPVDARVPDTFPPAAPGTYAPPVDRPVRDPFRLPHGQYGPGNRGLEYATVRGDSVRAIGAGRVAFAGTVAGRLVVSVVHPDGRRSSLTGLASLLVSAGQMVARGTAVGTAAPGLHLGVREGTRYVDPAPLLSPVPRRAVLVPVEGAPAHG
jgi:murein DD-endopeptidase MepM/ murein hydrolase activator NlpD